VPDRQQAGQASRRRKAAASGELPRFASGADPAGAAARANTPGGTERPELVHEQDVHEAAVVNSASLRGQLDAEERVVAQAAGLGKVSAGGEHRVSHAPLAWSAARSSTASTRWAIRPKSRPASPRDSWFAGFPASTAVCAKRRGGGGLSRPR